jgi:peroxin-19
MMNKITAGAGLGDFGGLIPSPEAGEQLKAPSSQKAPAASEESFQDTIKKTMEKIQASGEQATAAAKEEDTDDILAELLKQMQASGLDGEGGEEDFSKMLLGMMEQLTNKEILYEPMKELDDKFPAWMEKNRTTVAKADLTRYEEQQRIVAEIVAKFEETTYTDASAPDREYIVERMQLVRTTPSSTILY